MISVNITLDIIFQLPLIVFATIVKTSNLMSLFFHCPIYSNKTWTALIVTDLMDTSILEKNDLETIEALLYEKSIFMKTNSIHILKAKQKVWTKTILVFRIMMLNILGFFIIIIFFHFFKVLFSQFVFLFISNSFLGKWNRYMSDLSRFVVIETNKNVMSYFDNF